MKRITLLLASYFLLSFNLCAESYQQLEGIIHVQSTVSDGVDSIEEIVKKAKSNGIEAIFITDHALKKFEYGIFPLRSIIKKTVEESSILKFGAERYLDLISKVQKKYPELIIIPGAECAPFYYWQGSPFKRNLKMRAWHRHILAVGLDKPKDYEDLPLAGSQKSKFSLYRGDKWNMPYQNLIDYVEKRGGLTFWAHPEAENSVKIKGVLIHTLAYPGLLSETAGYTGFGIFHEGYKTVGSLGGIWDKILNEYCQGKRAKPIWAIGEIEYEGKKNESIDSVKNVFLVKEKSKDALLEALRKGRFYVVIPSDCELKLDEFSLSDLNSQSFAAMGQELPNAEKAVVNIFVSSKKELNRQAAVMLIKDGKLLKVYNEKLPFKINFTDEIKKDSAAKSYYRVDITYGNSRLISNPIFIEWSPSLPEGE